jgi:hypothetical protein
MEQRKKINMLVVLIREMREEEERRSHGELRKRKMGESPKREACDTALRAHHADLFHRYKMSGFRKLSSKVS